MKSNIKIIALLLMFSIGTSITPQKVSAQVSVSFQIFYDNLSPYGYWVDNPDYGYVWVPNVSSGFTPYSTNGYWIFTEDGWTWVSNYAWGWAPFHYGRWFYDSYYGWLWVPGNEWSPGWVIWRRSEGYYGWAPLGPGISIDFAYSPGYNVPYNHWRFVRDRDFGRRDINNYYINSSNNTSILNKSTVINNFREDKTRNVRYNAGPDRTEVERRAGKTFTPLPVKESSRPGENLRKDQLQIYKPQVQKNNANERKPAPSKVVNLKDVRPATERKANTQQPTIQQPNKQQPTREQPTRQQPNINQPNKQQQPKVQPTRQQPNINQPNKQQPPKEQPIRQLPNINQPNKQQQPKVPPTRQQPNINQPNKQQQPKEQPTRQLPNINQPNKQQQPKVQPTRQQPNINQPNKQQQPKEQPTRQLPNINQPNKQQQPKV